MCCGPDKRRLQEKRVRLKLSDDACAWLAKHGFDPQFGARPMARLIRTEIEDRLATELLFGALQKGGTVYIGLEENEQNMQKSPLTFQFNGAKKE